MGATDMNKHDVDIFINGTGKNMWATIGRLFKITRLLTHEKAKPSPTRRFLCPNRPQT